MKKRIKGWTFFGGVFIAVCVWRIWFGLFLIFAYALIETALRGKRSFCFDTCPIGNVLDFADDGKRKPIRENAAWAGYAGKIFFVIYIAFIAFVLIYFAQGDGAKWQYFFRLMAGSMILALLSELVFRKRFWCIYMCPLSRFMKGVLSFSRRWKQE